MALVLGLGVIAAGLLIVIHDPGRGARSESDARRELRECVAPILALGLLLAGIALLWTVR